MVTHQRVACSWNTRPDMAGSPHLPEDRAPSPPSPNIETAFTLSFFKLQFEVYCNHLIVWSYYRFIKKSNCDDVYYENEGAYICAFAFKIFSLPVPTSPDTQTFWQVPDPTLPKVKNPYPSGPCEKTQWCLMKKYYHRITSKIWPFCQSILVS